MLRPAGGRRQPGHALKHPRRQPPPARGQQRHLQRPPPRRPRAPLCLAVPCSANLQLRVPHLQGVQVWGAAAAAVCTGPPTCLLVHRIHHVLLGDAAKQGVLVACLLLQHELADGGQRLHRNERPHPWVARGCVRGRQGRRALLRSWVVGDLPPRVLGPGSPGCAHTLFSRAPGTKTSSWPAPGGLPWRRP